MHMSISTFLKNYLQGGGGYLFKSCTIVTGNCLITHQNQVKLDNALCETTIYCSALNEGILL